MMEPWQKSDSTAPKVRNNQAAGGATSYWAGMKPDGMHPADIVEGEITLLAKEPIFIPSDGKTTVSFQSLFQNEGDDSGSFEAALSPNAPAKSWKKIAAVKLEPSDATNPEYVSGYCTPQPGVATQGFEEIKGDFAALAGALVYVRFNLKYGSENRSTSQPCGWYVDDLKVSTTGTPGLVAAPPAGGPGPVSGPTPTAASKPRMTFGKKLKVKGKKATLSVKLTNAAINDASVTLYKGRKKVASTRVKTIKTGSSKVVFKLKGKLRRGAYKLKVTGTASTGAKFKAAGKTKA